MQAIEYNKENQQINDILTELQTQDKKFILCKVPAHIGIKGNEEADKAAKEAIDMPGMTTRLPYINYYLTIKRVRNSELENRNSIEECPQQLQSI